MRKLAFLLVFLGITSFAFSQYDTEEAKLNHPMSVGPFITLKAGVNTSDVTEGIKNGFTFNSIPDFGVTGYFPLTDQTEFGALVDLAYSSYSFMLKLYNAEDVNSTYLFNYLTIGPSLYISGFNLGINLGFPMGGKISGDLYNEGDLEAEDMATIIELKIGGVIPLFKNSLGRLNLVIQGGYFLSGIWNQDRIPVGDEYNPKPASLQFGLSYLFNLE